MSIPIKFSKERAEEFLEAIKEGRPFLPGPLGWSAADMLQLAGACRFAAMSHGPQAFGKEDPRLMHREHSEASSEQFLDDLTAAIEWCAEATRAVEDGEYAERFEEEHGVFVQLRDGEKSAAPVFGWKDDPHVSAEIEGNEEGTEELDAGEATILPRAQMGNIASAQLLWERHRDTLFPDWEEGSRWQVLFAAFIDPKWVFYVDIENARLVVNYDLGPYSDLMVIHALGHAVSGDNTHGPRWVETMSLAAERLRERGGDWRSVSAHADTANWLSEVTADDAADPSVVAWDEPIYKVTLTPVPAPEGRGYRFVVSLWHE